MSKATAAAGGRDNLFAVLLPTLECNLGCEYCFEEHPSGRWDLRETERILHELLSLAAARRIPHVMLHWQGGEPLLMGQQYWEAALPMAGRLARQAGVTLRQSMQTNLIGYRSEFAPLVRSHFGGALGTSFDLTRARKTRGGSRDSFTSKWREAFHHALQDDLEIGVLCLLDNEGIALGFERYAEILRNEYGITRVRFTLPFVPQSNRDRGFWADAEAAGQFLAEGFRRWHERGGNSWMEIRPFAHLAARFAGEASSDAGICLFRSNCADIALAIGPGGQVSLCDNFLHADDPATYGRMSTRSLVELFDGPERAVTRRNVGELSAADECTRCRYLAHCYGGCLVRCRSQKSAGTSGFHYCRTDQLLFQEVEATLLG